MNATLASAVLAGADDSNNTGGSIFSLVLLLAVPVGMYFLLIRPQRRKMREQQAVQAELTVGDEVVTTSGIFGTITGEDGPTRFWLEIDDDVQVRIARVAVQGRATPDADADESTVDEDSVDAADAD